MSIHTQSTDFVGTPFNARTAPLNTSQRWVAWDKYHIVDSFAGFDTEYDAVRNHTAAIDMSPLGKYEISGKEAGRFIDYLVTREINRQEVGQILYSPWCNENGKLVGDGMIFRLDENSYRISADPQYNWFNQHSSAFGVKIRDISDTYGILALQGPGSQLLLEAATGEDWSGFAFSRMRRVEIGGAEVDVMRQGFTGELGYELWVKTAAAVTLWDAIFAVGGGHGLQAVGFHAHDVARMEAGLIIVGPDYTGAGSDTERGAAIAVDTRDVRSPYETRLGSFVHLEKNDFIGKQALEAEMANGPDQIMRGLLIEWQDIAEMYTRQGLPPVVVPTPIWYPLNIISDGRKIGRATSIAWSPAADSIAGFAFIDRDYSEPGTEVEVEFRAGTETGSVRARVAKLPFIDIKRAV